MLNCLKTLFKNSTPQKSWKWFLGGTGIAGVILVLGVLSWVGWIDWGGVWKWLRGKESGSATIRNVGLVIGGFIAIPLALWRSIVAHRQAETAQRGLMNERYQKATEMLGSDVLTVRLGGIYALQRLAEEDPEQYHVQIMRLFCAFVRNPVKDKGERTERGHEHDTATLGDEVKEESQSETLREDVQAIMDAIATRSDADIALEKKADDFRPDLSNADLCYGIFPKGNLSGVSFFRADLSDAKLGFAAKLGGTTLAARVNLSGVDLMSAKLSGATLVVTGLNEFQLGVACADTNNPPDLYNCFDAKTEKQLVWNGKPPPTRQ